MKLQSLLNKRVVILDGATGTELQARGMPVGVCPEMWGIQNEQVLKDVAAAYRRAGSDIVYTCTFGANRYKLAQYKIRDVKTINTRIARITRAGAGKHTLVAGDIGPTGKFIEPFGKVSFADAVGVFKEQVKGLIAGGVDILVIETMMDIQEARAALVAVRKVSDIFTMVSMTFERDGRTLNGTDPLSALITLQSLGADAVGCNCSTGPEDMIPFIEKMKSYATVPLFAKPNAGLPKLQGAQTVFDMPPKEFAACGAELVNKGVNLIGGCCGTGPDYIRELKKRAGRKKIMQPLRKHLSALSSSRKSVVIEEDSPLIMIGECINPTGKKALKKELREGNMTLVRHLAKEQKKHGAVLLDVNVGCTGVDERKTLPDAVAALSVSNDLPLVIDSASPEAIEAALKMYPGRALINSLSAEKEKIKKLLPVIKRYGAMCILLPLDDKGIPDTIKKRQKIVSGLLRQVNREGLRKEDVVVDAMLMTVSAQGDAPRQSLETIRWCHDTLGCYTVLGLSNVSFGLPLRSWINAAYLAMARSQGLTMAIANPLSEECKAVGKALDLLCGQDRGAVDFIAYAGLQTQSGTGKKQDAKNPVGRVTGVPNQENVYGAIIEGNRAEMKPLLSRLLAANVAPQKIIDEAMIPAINRVGELFDTKEYFLPQLIASAETMKLGFDFLKPYLKKAQDSSQKKNVILLATVKGDIHDIGKNIVGLMLENHGFCVIDLGKDVSAERIIQEVKRQKTPLVGLSALMTTTMVNMKEVVERARKEKLDCRFIVGGAVITESYARSLGAEYAADGVSAVRIAKNLRARK